METETPTFPAPEGWEDIGWDDLMPDGTRVWWVEEAHLHVAVASGPGGDAPGWSRRPHWWWVSTSDTDGRPHIVGHEWDEGFADADDVIAYAHEAAARFND